MTPTETLLKHVKALGALAKRMDPGDAKQRVEARYEEAKAALKAEKEKNHEPH